MRRVVSVAVAAVLVTLFPVAAAAASPAESATTTPIKHLVMLMQDNHSFDNYFGTYPGADGIPPGTCLPIRITTPTDKCVKPFHLDNAPVEDLSLGVGVQKRQYNGGKMNGFVAAYRRLGLDGTSAMGYYDRQDLPYYWNVADEYVLFDRFFSSTTVGARESYLYWTSGTAPASDNPLTSDAGYNRLPTIFDRLEAKNVSAKFYVENFDERATGRQGARYSRQSQIVKVPLLSMERFRDGGDLAGRVVDLDEYYSDLRSGTLPAVSYIVTSGSSENPPASLTAGQTTIRKLTTELARSSSWETSAFMWTYDGWGGWYDHVAPPRVDARGYGFRVPALLVSPYAKRGVVDHTVLDYTAMLKFIETNWQVEPLSARDAASTGLDSAFDFSAGPRPPQILSASRGPEGALKLPPSPAPAIYTIYGLALVLVTALTGTALMAGTPLGTRIAYIPAAAWVLPKRRAARSPLGAQSAARFRGAVGAYRARWTYEHVRRVDSPRLPDGSTWQEWYENLVRPQPSAEERPGVVTPHPAASPAVASAARGGISSPRLPLSWISRLSRSAAARSIGAAGSGLQGWLREHWQPVEPGRLSDGSTWQEWYENVHPISPEDPEDAGARDRPVVWDRSANEAPDSGMAEFRFWGRVGRWRRT